MVTAQIDLLIRLFILAMLICMWSRFIWLLIVGVVRPGHSDRHNCSELGKEGSKLSIPTNPEAFILLLLSPESQAYNS